MKKKPRAIILKKCSKNHDLMLYCSRNMARDRCNFFFWAVFCTFTPLPPAPNSPKSQKSFWKRKNQFTLLYQKLWSDDVRFLRSDARQTEGRTEKVKYRGWCPTWKIEANSDSSKVLYFGYFKKNCPHKVSIFFIHIVPIRFRYFSCLSN